MTKPASAAVPVEAAKVEERQVSINVLTVGTRQITQALYKQLPELDIIDRKTGLLRGRVWGWVNIHDSHCGDKSMHMHVIWEYNGKLMKDRFLLYCGSSLIEENWHQSYQSILNTDQLFIAVSGVWK